VGTPWPYGHVGLVLAGEELPASRLVQLGQAAEQNGFGFSFVSDHFHPWNFQQGHGSYIWPVLGALASVTKRLGIVSAVTCPIRRIHPTTLAQAASTVYHLSGGRFILGLGTGENLNEHIEGQAFPPFSERLARLEESLLFVRNLLVGEEVTGVGDYFSVDRAQLFDSAPDLPIYLAASGPKSASLAKKLSDGLICLGPRGDLVQTFGHGGAPKRPRLAQISVCYAASEAKGAEIAHRRFPEVAMEGTLFTELTTPAEFSKAASQVSEADVQAAIVCGPDPLLYQRAIEDCLEAGFDGVALHQIGDNQKGFLEFWTRELKRFF
jgi:coenzyme F420-dependent glucose-6-phosphate dehydrogenase